MYDLEKDNVEVEAIAGALCGDGGLDDSITGIGAPIGDTRRRQVLVALGDMGG